MLLYINDELWVVSRHVIIFLQHAWSCLIPHILLEVFQFSYLWVADTWVFFYMLVVCVALFQLFYTLYWKGNLTKAEPLKHWHPVIYFTLNVVCIGFDLSVCAREGVSFYSKWTQTGLKCPHGGDIALLV